jgi:hypothetical protein
MVGSARWVRPTEEKLPHLRNEIGQRRFVGDGMPFDQRGKCETADFPPRLVNRAAFRSAAAALPQADNQGAELCLSYKKAQ